MRGWVLTAGLAALGAASPAPAPSAGAPRLSRIALPGEGPIASLLATGPLAYGGWRWDARGVPEGPLRIRVDRGAQLVSVFRGGHEIGTAVILYGAPEKPTPAGRFIVRAKLRAHRSSLYDADMPFTLRLTDDGIALHGSRVAPGAATHGCIGLPPAFAERLFDAARLGTPVEIV